MPKFWKHEEFASLPPGTRFRVAAWPRGYTHRGKTMTRGEEFDRSSLPESTAAEMYANGWIEQVPAGEATPVAEKPAGPAVRFIFGKWDIAADKKRVAGPWPTKAEAEAALAGI